MTAPEAQAVLVKAFRALRRDLRENLRWHLDHGTVPLAGARARLDWVSDGKP